MVICRSLRHVTLHACLWGICTEVAEVGRQVAVRDSKLPDGPALMLTRIPVSPCVDSWRVRLFSIREGRTRHESTGGV
ncbi:DUF397 domain-containing protein [Actinomadura sp. 9N407]|uniref:DUF397 domain-containing protein n=1 Tax=Actinomadura sp. 9N407 TaxID=3375154 RepID=UPI0037AE4663